MLLALALLTQPLATPSPLEGEWQTGCEAIGRNGRHGFRTRLAVRGDTLTATSQVYALSDCATPTIRTTYRAKIAAAAQHDGAVDLDHVVRSIEMTLDAPDVVTLYNRLGSGCGFGSGWQRAIARGVEGRHCAPFTFPFAGARLYERLWIAGDTLRLGSFPIVWTNTAPERRPTAPGSLRFTRVTP